MTKTNDNFIIFTVNGGAGKNVMATAVVKAIKNQHPEKNIIVVTAYKEIWMYNPNVYRTYIFGNTPNFYNDYIKDKSVEIFSLEPYSTTDYILKKKHLIELWCKIYNVWYNDEKPELFFNSREIDYTINKFNISTRPYMVIQTNGGGQQETKFSWMRDLPVSNAQEVVNYFNKNFRIIHIRRDDQIALNGVEQFKGNLRELMTIIRFSNKRLFIDSVCQHIACALERPSTVTWVRNNPEILGYTIHDNIVTEVQDELDVTQDSFLEPYDITGNVYQCPFKEQTKLFDTETIINSINQQK